MNKNVRYAVLAILIIGILLTLVLSLSSPLLYSFKNDIFHSRFHENAKALKLHSLNSTDDILPLLQEFIDYSGPISLNIRIHDIEQARRYLERFQKSHGSIKSLIIRLDMDESEIRELEQNTAMQKEIMDLLMNTSVSLDALQSMEIQYSSENNNDMLTTIRLRGDELRKKLRGINARYQNATEKVVDIGTKFGLDVNDNKASQKQVEEIIREMELPDDKTSLPVDPTTLLSVDTLLIPGDERVSLYVSPTTGKYREVIRYQGISLSLRGNTTLRSDRKSILLYIDDQLLSNTTTDTFGYYNVVLPIDRIRAGIHDVYARSPTSRSGNRTLTVIPVDSVTNLTIGEPDKNGNVICYGSVIANYPVTSATVQITLDKDRVIATKTDADGNFTRVIQLLPGRHTLIANFSGVGYPINPSESELQVVDISLLTSVKTDYVPLLIVIAGIVIFITLTGAAVFYLRKMSQRKTSVPDTPRQASFLEEQDSEYPKTIDDLQEPMADQNNPDNDSRESAEESLIAYYTKILKERGLTVASWSVYQQLAARIAYDLQIKRHKALTAREMSRNCKGKPYCGPFTRLISIYERIRYGGQVSVKDQTIFESALYSTDEQMGGEKH